MATLIVPLAIGLASRFLISLLTPKQNVEGQRLDSLDVPKSEFGYNLSKPFGRVRYDGCNLFWSKPLREVIEKKSAGGKGGGGGTIKEYIYFATAGFQFGWEGCVVSRMWFDGKLVYNPLSQDSATQIESVDLGLNQFEFYPGTLTQTPSAVIESVEGIGEVPAFTNRPYITINELDLTEDFANRLPKVDVEVIAGGTDTNIGFSFGVPADRYVGNEFSLYPTVGGDVRNVRAPLSDALRYVCNDAGLVEGTDYDIFFDQYIIGTQFAQSGNTYKSFIEDLQRTYFFLTVTENGKILFLPQDGYSPALPILDEDLAAHEDSEQVPEKYVEKRAQTTDLPTAVIVDYKNANKDYQRGIAQAVRHVSNHKNEIKFTSNCVLTDSEALTAATKNLYQTWAQRQTVENIRLLPRYLCHVQPGYLIQVPIRGQSVTLQVKSVEIGANYILNVSGVVIDYASLEEVDKGTDTDYDFGTDFNVKASLAPVVLDIPLLDSADSQSGVYMGAVGTEDDYWTGGIGIDAPSGSTLFESATTLPGKATRATLSLDLPQHTPYIIDEINKITVDVVQGTLESITQVDFETSLYNILILEDTGEIIAYRDANIVSGTTYELSYLARGLYGTEQDIASPSLAGQRVFFLRPQNFIGRADRSVGELTQAFDYKVIYSGETVTDNPFTETQTYQGISLRPYSPEDPIIEQTPTDDFIITWERRTRLDGEWGQATLEVPLNETSETFDVEILNAAATVVLRTVTVNDNSFTYTNADIITDFGSVPTELDFNVYQISDTFGRGRPLQARDLPVMIN